MAKRTKNGNSGQNINDVAMEYQTLNRQMKELDSKMKPLKNELIEYAKEHQSDMDGAFQLKFDCGAYVSLRVTDKLDYSEDAKIALMDERGEFVKSELDEKRVIEAQASDSRLRKLLTKLGIIVGQKETYAVYAN